MFRKQLRNERMVKCALSDKRCQECERNPDCLMYTDRYVLVGQLKKLQKNLEDTEVIVKAILKRQ